MSSLPVILFDGVKGGVGKSSACGAFADWALIQGMPIAIVDGDARNPDVHRIFDGIVPSIQINLRTHDGWMDLADFIHANPDRMIFVSMPAGVGNEMGYEAPRFARQIAESGRSAPVLVWVINRTQDSINLLNATLKAFGDESLGAKFVMKNLFFGSRDKFGRWDASKTKKDFEKAGGISVELHELHERTMDKLFADVEKIVPYSQALVSPRELDKSIHGLSPSEATELREWLRDNAITFQSMAQVMKLPLKAGDAAK